jgi:ATP-dependent DNA ligase
VIGGYIPGSDFFDALLVGYYRETKLLFVAKIRNGFVSRVRRELFRKFSGLETKQCPFANLPEAKNARQGMALTAEAMKQCRWLRPELVAQIEFAEWTENDHLRHARFIGLREDKNPRQVGRK